MAAFKSAVAAGVALETDMKVSKDGVIFMLHDVTFERTTNIATVFPDRAGDFADSFTWEEIRMLDAGSWFPGFENAHERIPSLEELLEYLTTGTYSSNTTASPNVDDRVGVDGTFDPNTTHPLMVIDIKVPHANNAYHDQYFQLIADLIKRYHYQPWTEWSQHGQSWTTNVTLEGALQYWGPHVSTMTDADIDHFASLNNSIVHTEYQLTNAQIRHIHQRNMSVQAWTVNSQWIYSQLWCLGVKYIITNAAPSLLELKQPLWFMTSGDYFILWIVGDSVAFLVVIITLIAFCCRRRQRLTNRTLVENQELLHELLYDDSGLSTQVVRQE